MRAIVADADRDARRRTVRALRDGGVVVVAEAHAGREAIELTAYYRPDVVLLGAALPDMDGVRATRRILKAVPDQLVLLLAGDDVGVEALRAGAAGFLAPDVPADVLPRALQRAADGEALIPRRVGMRLVEHMRRQPEGAIGLRPVRSDLTAREWEVVDLLCQGLGTEEIAETLVVSTETVRSHVKHVLRKLDARSRAEAIAAAQELRGVPSVPG